MDAILSETAHDIERALKLFCLEAEERVSLRVNSRGRRCSGAEIAAKVRRAPLRRRRLAGRRLIERYRQATGCEGPIDWQRFHEWLKEHLAELTLLKVVLTVISLLLIL